MRKKDTSPGRGWFSKEDLAAVIDRRRGLGWCIRFDQDGSKDIVKLHVFTVFDQNVTVGATTVEKNQELIPSFDIGRLDVSDVVKLGTEASAYGKVLVLGERVRSMFTLSFSDGTLRAGWTSAQETAYKAALGVNPEHNDAERATDKYQDVFQHFTIPDGFNWKVGNGAGGTKHNVCPTIEDDGDFDPSKLAPMRRWDSARMLEDKLLIEEESKPDRVAPEFRKPFVVAKDLNDRFYFVHRGQGSNQPSAHVTMLDTKVGFELAASPNHAFAKNNWGGAAATANQPKVDFNTFVATVCAEMDERLKVLVTIDGNDPDLVLKIEVPEAHFWWVVPGTVIDVQDGALVRHSASAEFPGTSWLRNDRAKLQTVAALAQAWYGRKRSAISFTLSEVNLDLRLGNLLQKLVNGPATTPVNTIISEVAYDFRDGMTTYNTDYCELDFVER